MCIRDRITGHFTPEQAKDLANVLKSGKMPAPAHIVQEDICLLYTSLTTHKSTLNRVLDDSCGF